MATITVWDDRNGKSVQLSGPDRQTFSVYFQNGWRPRGQPSDIWHALATLLVLEGMEPGEFGQMTAQAIREYYFEQFLSDLEIAKQFGQINPLVSDLIKDKNFLQEYGEGEDIAGPDTFQVLLPPLLDLLVEQHTARLWAHDVNVVDLTINANVPDVYNCTTYRSNLPGVRAHKEVYLCNHETVPGNVEGPWDVFVYVPDPLVLPANGALLPLPPQLPAQNAPPPQPLAPAVAPVFAPAPAPAPAAPAAAMAFPPTDPLLKVHSLGVNQNDYRQAGPPANMILGYNSNNQSVLEYAHSLRLSPLALIQRYPEALTSQDGYHEFFLYVNKYLSATRISQNIPLAAIQQNSSYDPNAANPAAEVARIRSRIGNNLRKRREISIVKRCSHFPNNTYDTRAGYSDPGNKILYRAELARYTAWQAPPPHP